MNPLEAKRRLEQLRKSKEHGAQANQALKQAEAVLDREHLVQRVVTLSRELASMSPDNPFRGGALRLLQNACTALADAMK